jgi:hypothetical protein
MGGILRYTLEHHAIFHANMSRLQMRHILADGNQQKAVYVYVEWFWNRESCRKEQKNSPLQPAGTAFVLALAGDGKMTAGLSNHFEVKASRNY